MAGIARQRFSCRHPTLRALAAKLGEKQQKASVVHGRAGRRASERRPRWSPVAMPPQLPKKLPRASAGAVKACAMRPAPFPRRYAHILRAYQLEKYAIGVHRVPSLASSSATERAPPGPQTAVLRTEPRPRKHLCGGRRAPPSATLFVGNALPRALGRARRQRINTTAGGVRARLSANGPPKTPKPAGFRKWPTQHPRPQRRPQAARLTRLRGRQNCSSRQSLGCPASGASARQPTCLCF